MDKKRKELGALGRDFIPSVPYFSVFAERKNAFPKGAFYAKRKNEKYTTRDLRRGRGCGKQLVRRRRRNDRRASSDKNGIGGKAGARNGDPVDPARIGVFVFLLRIQGAVQYGGVDPDCARSDGGRVCRRKTFGKIAR